MLLLPALRCQQVRAIGRAIDAHFPLGSAIDRADFLALGRAIPLGAAFSANWADRFSGHFTPENELQRATRPQLLAKCEQTAYANRGEGTSWGLKFMLQSWFFVRNLEDPASEEAGYSNVL
jgi:hypothetical protein